MGRWNPFQKAIKKFLFFVETFYQLRFSNKPTPNDYDTSTSDV